MKKLTVLCFVLALGLGGIALAVPGPDAPDEHPVFDVIASAQDTPKGVPFTVQAADMTTFEEADGWDFGSRLAYSCAWVEFFDVGAKLLEVSYKLVSDYPNHAEINDRFGVESPDTETPPELCWELGGNAEKQSFVADGSDHFPHGADLAFYRDQDRDGVVRALPGDEFARIRYTEPEHSVCGNLYWTDGDEPGEAWLWWDEDGASDRLEHGDGLCGGGPEEPVALVQAKALFLAPGVGVCTESIAGKDCIGVDAETTATAFLSGTLDDGRSVTVDLSVFGIPGVPTSCGSGTIALPDGREAEIMICL